MTDLDDAYANAPYIPDAETYPETWARLADDHRRAEAAIGRARLNVAYGAGERQKLDIFHPAGRAQGLVVFVHGGYWMRFGREDWSHFSAGLTARGWAVALPSYTRAPDARIAAITREIARAVETAAGLVTGPVRLTGHSAGGHLVARMGCRDVALAADVRSRLARIVPISPLSDLAPLRLTAMNATLGLDADEAHSESPVHHPPPEAPVTVWVGAEERPAFLDQAEWLTRAWNAGHRVAPGRHHFDVIEELRDPDSPLVAAILA